MTKMWKRKRGGLIYNIVSFRKEHVQPFWYFFQIIFSPEIRPKPRGHVIATRITSENPDEVRTKNPPIHIVQNLKSFTPWRIVMIPDGCQTILALPAKRERNIYMFYLKISGVSGISRTSPFDKRVIESEIWNHYVNLLVELCLREG